MTDIHPSLQSTVSYPTMSWNFNDFMPAELKVRNIAYDSFVQLYSQEPKHRTTGYVQMAHPRF